MVDGHEKVKGTPRPCAVVDLDGTLVRGNSLRMLIRFLVSKFMRAHRYAAVARILSLLAARKAGLISHVAMKHPLHLLAVDTLTEAEVEQFCNERLLPALNRELLRRLTALQRDGYAIVIATAAPDLYLPILCRLLGFDAYIATAPTPRRSDYTETRGDFKKANALALAEKAGMRIALVATDHEDDLPLLMLPGIERLLVAPTTRLRLLARAASLDFCEI